MNIIKVNELVNKVSVAPCLKNKSDCGFNDFLALGANEQHHILQKNSQNKREGLQTVDEIVGGCGMQTQIITKIGMSKKYS